jgi:hypothetical protein
LLSPSKPLRFFVFAGLLILIGSPVATAQKRENMSEIEFDIHQIVGGHFSPDSLSPEIHAAISGRARNNAEQYLRAFDAMYLSDHFDAHAQSLLYLPSFLKLVSPSAPEHARSSAVRLLKLYDAVMVVFDDAADKDALFKLLPAETVRFLQRLDSRRKELHVLIE